LEDRAQLLLIKRWLLDNGQKKMFASSTDRRAKRKTGGNFQKGSKGIKGQIAHSELRPLELFGKDLG